MPAASLSAVPSLLVSAAVPVSVQEERAARRLPALQLLLRAGPDSIFAAVLAHCLPEQVGRPPPAPKPRVATSSVNSQTAARGAVSARRHTATADRPTPQLPLPDILQSLPPAPPPPGRGHGYGLVNVSPTVPSSPGDLRQTDDRENQDEDSMTSAMELRLGHIQQVKRLVASEPATGTESIENQPSRNFHQLRRRNDAARWVPKKRTKVVDFGGTVINNQPGRTARARPAPAQREVADAEARRLLLRAEGAELRRVADSYNPSRHAVSCRYRVNCGLPADQTLQVVLALGSMVIAKMATRLASPIQQ